MYIDKELFEAWMERLLERIEVLDRKMEKLNNSKNQLNGENLLDNQDLCMLLKVSTRTLQRYRSSGLLPYRRIQQKTFYLESDVHKFICQKFVSRNKKGK
uniref:helix-turn-helix domain-containing protein n=1 Tax=Mariniphaga anaerophila TaxID=1484053 RepID=UPI000932DA58